MCPELTYTVQRHPPFQASQVMFSYGCGPHVKILCPPFNTCISARCSKEERGR